jgi:hypothetical protein
LTSSKKFQNLIFPGGFILDIKNDNFIINKISPLYRGITPEIKADYAKNFVLVTLRYSVYKEIVAEIIRWNDMLKNVLT